MLILNLKPANKTLSITIGPASKVKHLQLCPLPALFPSLSSKWRGVLGERRKEKQNAD